MPTLIVENVPVEVYECLQKRAASHQRSLPEEMLHMLEEVLRGEESPNPRLPDFLTSEEISAPCDLPRSSSPEPVVTCAGQPRSQDVRLGDHFANPRIQLGSEPSATSSVEYLGGR